MFRFQHTHSGMKPSQRGTTIARRLFGTLLLAVGLTSLTACGKKGPLYLPEKPQEVTDETLNTSGQTTSDDTTEQPTQSTPSQQETP